MNPLIPTLLVTLVPTMAPAQTPVLLRTISNPAPEYVGFFGRGMAALGHDRVLIGAPNYIGNPTPPTNAAAVHLFHTNGTLLTTITKPPAVGGEFGSAITTLGSDRVVIGLEYGYSVCVFTTNGVLVKTITDPAQPMGSAVTAFGNDKLLIGAHYANEDPDTWVTYGAAYLYSTNGTLLQTITNPAPAADDWFGHRIAVLGNDRVVIGAPDDDSTGLSSGSAYVFNLNGTLLATITNPASGVGDRFGLRLVAFGKDDVLIAAHRTITPGRRISSAFHQHQSRPRSPSNGRPPTPLSFPGQHPPPASYFSKTRLE